MYIIRPFLKVNDSLLTAPLSFRSSLSLRVFSDVTENMWKRNVKDIGGEILCVSQFTLMANTAKRNKPDFHRAMVSRNCFSFPEISSLISALHHV